MIESLSCLLSVNTCLCVCVRVEDDFLSILPEQHVSFEDDERERRKEIYSKEKRDEHLIGRQTVDVSFAYFRSDLIGCMSFNMKTLLKTSTTSSKVRKINLNTGVKIL